MKLSLVSLAIAIVLGKNICSGVPVFQGFPSYLTISESCCNGSMLFNFTVTGTPDITNVITDGYDTEQLVKLERTVPGQNVFVKVITIDIFDRDGHGNVGHPGKGSVKLSFRAEDASGNVVRKDMTVYITDINDNAPILKNLPYTWEIPERNASETVYTQISADDYDNGDNGISGLRYNIVPKTPSKPVAEEYLKIFGIDGITGQVSLINDTLDYETNSFYQFSVIVKDQKGADGCNSATADLTIKILDVQDTPPYFVGIPYRKTITEEKPSNLHVLTVSAIDGDRGVPNNVNYTIRQGLCSDLFNISEDGEIRTTQVIDRDASEFGECVLTIVASEIPSSNFTIIGPTSVSTDLYVSVSDVDDNPPMFTYNSYSGTVPRYVSPNSSITLREVIHVSDNDQDFNFTTMNVTLLWSNGSDCDAFFAKPTFIHWSGDVQILVKDPALIQNSIDNTFHLKVIATGTMHQSEASVIITILDTSTNNMSLCPTSSPVRCPTATAAPTSSSLDANVACSTVSEHDLRFARERLLMMRREVDMFIQFLEN